MSRPLTLREVVGQAQIEVGIAQQMPNTVIGTLDQDIAQMLALLSAVADEVLLEEPYKVTLGDGVWAADASGKPRPLGPTANEDLILFDGRLAITGLKYRFRAAKGLEYGEDLRDFNTRLAHLALTEARILDLDADPGRQV
jgi:hypothetical protein